MRASVLATQPLRLDPRVHLGGRHAGVPQQLLDRAQVGAALEQMGGEGVAQRVRGDVSGDRGLAAPSAPGGAARPTATGGGRGATGTAPARSRATRAPAVRARQVALEGPLGGLTHRDDPRLRALAGHAQASPTRSRDRPVEVDDLLGPQPAGVGELEQGTVADLERARGRDPVEQRRDLDRARARAGAARVRASGSAGARRGSGPPRPPGRGDREGCAPRPACGRRSTSRGRAPTAAAA